MNQILLPFFLQLIESHLNLAKRILLHFASVQKPFRHRCITYICHHHPHLVKGGL